ncbi:MAG: pseudouridine-5'-phosphate glycosidase [Pseudomonadota bacterium]
MADNPFPLVIHDEVRDALSAARPVVALESTIISHGMPYPDNVATAHRVEQAVRSAGATPATIAIIDGQPVVGLSGEQLESLGKHGDAAIKCSRRDLPFILARGTNGATTVAGTMIVAAAANIPIMATGGIGGVHRGVEKTLDVSADLEELGRSTVAVVCSGVKSILDIGKTLEYLETQGVPVAGFQTATMPAFYSRDSEFELEHRFIDAADAAAVIATQRSSGLNGGLVVAVPCPAADAIERSAIDSVISDAIDDMNQQGITGKATTPFLLARIAERTRGKSLAANIELVVNNARIGAEIAVELARR